LACTRAVAQVVAKSGAVTEMTSDGSVLQGHSLRMHHRPFQQVRFCRDRFSPTGESGYSGIRGAEGRTQVHCISVPKIESKSC
jgi:hypothetical protein